MNIAKYLILIITLSSCSTFSKYASKLNPISDKNKDRVKIVDNRRAPASVLYNEKVNYSYNLNRDSYNPLDNNKKDDYTGSLWSQSASKGYIFASKLQKSVGDFLTIKFDKNTRKQLVYEYEASYVKRSSKRIRNKYLKKVLKDKKEYSRNDVKKLMYKSAKLSELILKKKRVPTSTKKKIFMIGEIKAKVISVLDNGAYKIIGAKRLVINKKPYKLFFGGIVKPNDINPDDSIYSDKIIASKLKFKRVRS